MESIDVYKRLHNDYGVLLLQLKKSVNAEKAQSMDCL